MFYASMSIITNSGKLIQFKEYNVGGKSGNVPLNIATSFEVPKIKNEFIRSGQTDSRYFNDVLRDILHVHTHLLKTRVLITKTCRYDR